MNPLRPLILAAAASPRLRRWVTRVPLTAAVVRRFVAGETREKLLPVVANLLASGRMVSVDLLGEDTTDPAGAHAAVTEYLALIDDLATMARQQWPDYGAAQPNPELGMKCPVPVEVSVKLSALGQALPEGDEVATANLRTLCTAAARAGVWVTVDAENHTTTDATLATVRQLRTEFPWLAVVVQAYLRRTEAECRQLAAAGVRVRLCKGAYREPDAVVFASAGAIDASYLRCLAVLMSGAGYPMVATHDPVILAAAARLAHENNRSATTFEYQMLYGVRAARQRQLAAAGEPIRVYLPYGTQWYGYLMRRLAERPANLRFFLRALIGR